MKQEQVMKMRMGEKPLMMITKVATTRVIVVVITVAMTVEIARMIATVTVKATKVKTMIANIVVMIGVHPLVIEKMMMKGLFMKTTLMMM